MRVCVATIAPNITLPIWARLFKRAISPVVDESRFIIGSPIGELRDLAGDCLPFAKLTVRKEFQSHGHALNELFSKLGDRDEVLVIEDDCFVTCPPWVIEQAFLLVQTWEVVGSRMARTLEHGTIIGGDTFGEGLYPNMLFCRAGALGGSPDFVSRDGRDVGGLLGEAVHARGLHNTPSAHLRQNRLSRYPGCTPVDPETWDETWLHVGEMSLPPRFDEVHRGGRLEAMAAYSAAIDTGECHPGSQLDKMREIVDWAYHRPEYGDAYLGFRRFMRRVYNTTP